MIRAKLRALGVCIVLLTPTACGAGAGAVGDASPVQKTTVPGQCPHFVPFEDGTHGIADRSDSVIWQGRMYTATLRHVSAAGEAFVVRCSVSDVLAEHPQGTGDISAGLPDLTATHLPQGTPVHAVKGVEHTCSLAVERPGKGWVAYDVTPVPANCAK